MKMVKVCYVDGTKAYFENVTKVWLENSTKRYILHRKDEGGQEHHTFINRENVLEFDVLDPDGWKQYKKRDPHNTHRSDRTPYYTSDEYMEEDEDCEE